MFALQAARRLSREDMAEPTITNNIGESGPDRFSEFPFFLGLSRSKEPQSLRVMDR